MVYRDDNTVLETEAEELRRKLTSVRAEIAQLKTANADATVKPQLPAIWQRPRWRTAIDCVALVSLILLVGLLLFSVLSPLYTRWIGRR